MSEFKAKTEIRVGSERSFGLVFAGVFLIIALFPVFFGGSLRIWAVAIAAVFLVLAFAAPHLLRPLNLLWFKFGLLLGKIISPIVMGLIFGLTVIPIGLIRRLRHRDPLNQQLDPEAPSYWIDIRAEQGPPSSMRRQF